MKKILMRITAYDSGLVFNPDDPHINALVTYGVIKKGNDRMCEIVNPIYQHRILQTFKPTINGLESVYLPEDIDFTDYLSTTGQLEIAQLLDNFQDFIARAGFRILQVPDTPQEYVGQHLLYAYLDTFARIVGGDMFLEVQTGRGRMDLLLLHNQRKYIVETKIWEGNRSYQAGKTATGNLSQIGRRNSRLLRCIRSPAKTGTSRRNRNRRWRTYSELCHSCYTSRPFKHTLTHRFQIRVTVLPTLNAL